MEDFEQDMLLLFNNACQYNDPDSQIYKDALTLLRELLKKKKEILNEQSQFSPNIPSLVQSLLNLLHANVLNYKVNKMFYCNYCHGKLFTRTKIWEGFVKSLSMHPWKFF